MPQGQWRTQFDRDFQVPEEVSNQIKAGTLEDTSWGNDAMPSFCTLPSGHFVLWVDHPVKEERECDGEYRFLVALNSYHDDNYAKGYDTYYYGDDLAEALRVIQELEAKEVKV